MTPETIRNLSDLRQEFYALFATAMNPSVSITKGNPHTSNPAIASWVDQQQCLNYLWIHAHTAPDALVPDRPFLLRVSINKGIGVPFSVKRQSHQGHNQGWCFELTVLPEEILDFVPWIVSLIQSQVKEFTPLVKEPPHPLSYQPDNQVLLAETWTESARRCSKMENPNPGCPSITVIQSVRA